MKNLLITGNVASLAAHLCQRLSRQYHLVVAANQAPPIALGKGVEMMTLSGGKTLEHVFQAYPFQAMIFLSTRGEQQSRLAGEADLLSGALALAKRHGVDRVLYLTSGELSRANEAVSERGVLLQAMEQLCAAYLKQGLEVTIVRLPCVFGPGEPDTLIGRLLAAAARGETAVLPFSRDAQMDFISAAEVAQLTYRLLDKDRQPEALLMVRGAEALTVRELTALLSLLGASVSQGTGEMGYPPMEESDFQRSYGFTPAERLSVALDSLYTAIKTSLDIRQARQNPVRSFLHRHPSLARGASLLLGYGAMEALQMLQDGGQLPAMDLRLLYVALISAAHGLHTGLLAVVFASFSIARGYGASGMDAFVLLSDWKAWVPFIVLILTGSFAGYAHDKGRGEARSAREAANTLEKRCAFLQDLYKQSLLSKDQADSGEKEKQEGLEQQLAQLRKGQERLEQEWLTLLKREQSRWDMELAEKESREEAAPQDKAGIKARQAEENSLKEQADFAPRQPGQRLTDEAYAPLAYRAFKEPAVLEDEEDDDASYEQPLRAAKHREQAGLQKLADQGARQDEGNQRAEEWAEQPTKADGMAAGSPFGRLTPAERRKMLEAMQVRSRLGPMGKPKRRR